MSCDALVHRAEGIRSHLVEGAKELFAQLLGTRPRHDRIGGHHRPQGIDAQGKDRRAADRLDADGRRAPEREGQAEDVARMRIQHGDLAAVRIAHEQPDNASNHDDDPGGLIIAIDDGARRQIQFDGLAQQRFRRARRKPREKAAARSLVEVRLEPARSVRAHTPPKHPRDDDRRNGCIVGGPRPLPPDRGPAATPLGSDHASAEPQTAARARHDGMRRLLPAPRSSASVGPNPSG